MKNRSSSSSSPVWSSMTVLVKGFQKTTRQPQWPSSTFGGRLRMLQPMLCHSVERPPPPGRQPVLHGVEFEKSGFTPWYGFREATLECLPGWLPPTVVRHGRRQGRRSASRASMMRAVTSSRIWALAGHRCVLRCPSPIQLNRSGRSAGCLPYQEALLYIKRAWPRTRAGILSHSRLVLVSSL